MVRAIFQFSVKNALIATGWLAVTLTAHIWLNAIRPDLRDWQQASWTGEAVYFLARVSVISLLPATVGALFGRPWRWMLSGMALATMALFLDRWLSL